MRAEVRPGVRLAFFGAMTPLAREIRTHLEAGAFTARAVHLYDSGGTEGSLTDFDGEALIVSRAEEQLLAQADISFVCGDEDPRAEEYIAWAAKGGGRVIDLSGASRNGARAPLVNCDVNPGLLDTPARVFSAPHPVAHPLSTIFHRISRAFTLRCAAVTILRPASDFGEAGIEELHQQTVSLLSFSEPPVEIFGRRLAFNVIAAAAHSIPAARLEDRVRSDAAALAGAEGFDLGVRILQAPIFHGHCYSIRVEIGENAGSLDLARALALEGAVSISTEDDERTPADLAERTGIWIADIRSDPHRAGAHWIWAVADAVRSGAALNAARIATRLAETTA